MCGIIMLSVYAVCAFMQNIALPLLAPLLLTAKYAVQVSWLVVSGFVLQEQGASLW
jgi:hypothetical protein